MTRALLAPPSYPGLSLVRAGEVRRIAPLVPQSASVGFSLEVPDEYAYLAPLNDGCEWVQIDQSGTLSVSPPVDEPSGIIYVPVHVRESSGDTVVFVNVQIVAASEEGVNAALPALSYGGCARVLTGGYRKLTPMVWDRCSGEILAGVPAGYSFATGGDGRRVMEWVEVSPCGEVTAAPRVDTPAGTYHMPVEMTDDATGATTTAIVHIEVGERSGAPIGKAAASPAGLSLSVLVAGTSAAALSLMVLLAQFGIVPCLF